MFCFGMWIFADSVIFFYDAIQRTKANYEFWGQKSQYVEEYYTIGVARFQIEDLGNVDSSIQNKT